MLESPIGSRAIKDKTEVFSYKPLSPLGESDADGFDYLIEESREEPIQVLENQKRLMTFANINLPMSGRLRRAEDGGYDLVLTKDYLRFFHFGGTLEKEALIRVIFPGEELRRQVSIGAKFNFTVKGFYAMEPYSMPGIKRVWFMGIDSQELKDYRASLGLMDRYNGHDFLVLLSTEKGEAMKPQSYMRVNNSFLYA